MIVHVTRHGKERIGERCGLRKRAVQRLADSAFSRGKRIYDFSGSFRRYLEEIYLTQGNANNLRVYSEKCWLFADSTLITVWHLPNEYKSAANRAKKEAA